MGMLPRVHDFLPPDAKMIQHGFCKWLSMILEDDVVKLRKAHPRPLQQTKRGQVVE
jgi:hypothetical protein